MITFTLVSLIVYVVFFVPFMMKDGKPHIVQIGTGFYIKRQWNAVNHVFLDKQSDYWWLRKALGDTCYTTEAEAQVRLEKYLRRASNGD